MKGPKGWREVWGLWAKSPLSPRYPLSPQRSCRLKQAKNSAGIIFNTRVINTVIAKNCICKPAWYPKRSMQFCGNLPLLCYLYWYPQHATLQPSTKLNSGRPSRRGIGCRCNPHSHGCPSSGWRCLLKWKVKTENWKVRCASREIYEYASQIPHFSPFSFHFSVCL